MSRHRQRRVRLDGGAVDLWRSPVVATADNDLIAEVYDEFGTAHTPIDERSGVLAHLKATVVAAAASRGKPVDEAGYLAALHAVAGDEGEVARRSADDDQVASHCRAASALADLAEERLRQAGLKRSDPSYPDAFVAEVELCGRQFNLPYGI